MTDADQTTPIEADPSLSGLIDQARTTPQGITALLLSYAQELAGEDGPRIAGIVLVSAAADALQAHLVSQVDAGSMARVLRAQADVIASPLPDPPAGPTDVPGSASPWNPEDDDTTGGAL